MLGDETSHCAGDGTAHLGSQFGHQYLEVLVHSNGCAGLVIYGERDAQVLRDAAQVEFRRMYRRGHITHGVGHIAGQCVDHGSRRGVSGGQECPYVIADGGQLTADDLG